ncbi:hypothetical protein [Planomicrobium okeanokoites]|uniref:hypothetical protein n=1 Tax=Planomicrobium okeanokoites TaxID=244 RepID=UPI0030FAF1FA
MKTKDCPKLIAIASVSGGGKTTAVRNVTNQLPNAKALYFDDYDFNGPEDLLQWMERGADYNEWNLDPMLTDIKRLLADSLDFIVLDFPFARLHHESSPYIDYTVFIDTPLDIALARRIIRDFAESSSDEILADAGWYADKGRAAYLQMLEDVKPDSDLIVDGSRSREEVCTTILLQLPY